MPWRTRFSILPLVVFLYFAGSKLWPLTGGQATSPGSCTLIAMLRQHARFKSSLQLKKAHTRPSLVTVPIAERLPVPQLAARLEGLVESRGWVPAPTTTQCSKREGEEMNVCGNKAEQGSTGKNKHLSVLADIEKREDMTQENRHWTSYLTYMSC